MLSGHRHQLQVQQGLQHRRRRAFAAFPGARGSRRTPGLEHEMTDPFTAKLRDAQALSTTPMTELFAAAERKAAWNGSGDGVEFVNVTVRARQNRARIHGKEDR